MDLNGDIKPGPLECGFDYSFLIPATGDHVPCVFIENHRVINLATAQPEKLRELRKIPGQVRAGKKARPAK